MQLKSRAVTGELVSTENGEARPSASGAATFGSPLRTVIYPHTVGNNSLPKGYSPPHRESHHRTSEDRASVNLPEAPFCRPRATERQDRSFKW